MAAMERVFVHLYLRIVGSSLAAVPPITGWMALGDCDDLISHISHQVPGVVVYPIWDSVFDETPDDLVVSIVDVWYIT